MTAQVLSSSLVIEVAAVEASWLAFAKHAAACETCAPIAKRCRRSPERSAVINSWWDGCCDDGKLPFAEWRGAVDVLRAAYLETHRTPAQGSLEVGFNDTIDVGFAAAREAVRR